MRIRFSKLLVGALLAASVAAPAALGAVTPVTVRVEGAAKTLLPERATTTLTRQTLVVKDKDPTHGCRGDTIAGAFELATRGNWVGGFFAGLGYFVKSIRGESPTGPNNFWVLWVNHKQASAGICSLTPRRGDAILFENGSGKERLLELQVPTTATRGEPFFVRAVSYDSKGKSRREGGVTVRGAGRSTVTNSRGLALVRFDHRGTLRLAGAKRGLVRSAIEPVRVK